ncbi:DHH family phosphoesterase [Paenibacillus lutrae]|uniref:Bifunctional oligoribonuclease/PAP phosphatase NrnA n=1 Tax=Paenibacillus lutrae TaxID=2078573 RepID=A0A7X3FG92_9BACL|nr:bifunctional oligoribonuclease/PAP phosphatase NrnA [Paenibacillus lutrae]MVO99112.1 bifunctional oligoribonuclease/PAP phosphatase NrnA [Paenibacillus lutrae]
MTAAAPECNGSYNEQLEAAKQFIEQYDDFLVVSHVQPDGDAISSTLAIGWLLHRLGKRYTLANEGDIPAKFNQLWGFEDIQTLSQLPENRHFSHVISVDCADFSRIGQVSQRFAESFELLNIDHHATNDRYGSCAVIQAQAAATVEIIYDLAKLFPFEADLDFGTCIYTGLLTDTGGFRYSSTTPKVMKTAADLLELGVKGSLLAEAYLERMTFEQIRILQRGLSTLNFHKQGKISSISVNTEDVAEIGASNEDMDGLVNYARNVEGVEVGLLFKQRDSSTVKVSFRSAGNVDVARIAQTFGGGGHVRAAGCTIKGTLEEAIRLVVEEVGNKLS